MTRTSHAFSTCCITMYHFLFLRGSGEFGEPHASYCTLYRIGLGYFRKFACGFKIGTTRGWHHTPTFKFRFISLEWDRPSDFQCGCEHHTTWCGKNAMSSKMTHAFGMWWDVVRVLGTKSLSHFSMSHYLRSAASSTDVPRAWLNMLKERRCKEM